MNLLYRYRDWQRARHEKRVSKLTAQAARLSESDQHDLLHLHHLGFVRAEGTGQSITRVEAEVQSLVRKQLRILIRPGTYFVATGGHQNMATIDQYSFVLSPLATHHITVSAACINADRPIPGQKDKFRGVSRVSDEVARFIEAARGENAMVIQAGVWALTDSYTRDDIVSHLVDTDEQGNKTHPITRKHCNRAREILDELEITHRLWSSDIHYEKKTVTYGDGVYDGEFRRGDRHGRGIYKWKGGIWDGDSYDGDWKDDQRTGRGTYFKPSGYEYTGEFLDGKEHGRGKARMSDGATYEGEWKDGDFHGQGISTWSSGVRYVGAYSNGVESGGWRYDATGARRWCTGRDPDGLLELGPAPPSADR